MPPIQTRALARVFAVLTPDLSLEPVAVTPGIYEELDARFDHFSGHVLVSEFGFSEPWPSWERHPAGDELVLLLMGCADLVLRVDGQDRIARLDAPGQYLIVPQGIWHTARPLAPTRMVFLTPGENTEHMALDDMAPCA
jgi:hypothetical protein